MERKTLTPQEIAAYIGVSTDTIYTMCKQKQIPYVRIRRRIFFHKETIDKWMRDQEESNCEAI